jgi:RNA polymerase sigma-70 factor, ECF subfamily
VTDTTPESYPAESAPDRQGIYSELLVLRCRRGDMAAFREIVALWERRLFFYLRRLTGDEQEAWDMLQQTWLKALRGIDSIREPRRLNAWLYTLARRAAADRIRELAADRQRHADDTELEAIADESPGPEEFENAALVHWGLDKLELAQRDILTLFFLEDFSLAEVGEILSLPPGTVKSRLHRAKAALRDKIQREGGER